MGDTLQPAAGGRRQAREASDAPETPRGPGAPRVPETPEVLVFGGTTEGREIAQWLGRRGTCRVYVSSLTEYGGSLVEGEPNVVSLTGQMPAAQMEDLMRRHGFACVVDATHPYAAGVSATVEECARATGTPRYRVLREGEPEGPWTGAADAQEAAGIVAAGSGRVLLTTGSKELPVYVDAMPDYRERLYVRILPVPSSIEQARGLDIPTGHIIAMQGPFSRELNAAILRQFGITAMVTKASGNAGGFWEKVQAAQECGVRLVVVHRPVEGEGCSVGELQRQLAGTLHL